jgi:YD repeat-containing protein
VSLSITSPFSAQTNSPDTPFNDYTSYGPFSTSQLTGGVQVAYSLPASAGQGQGAGLGAGSNSLLYNSLAADVKPIVAVEATVQSGGASPVPAPDSFKVDLAFGGVTAPTLYFNNSGLSSGTSPTIHIADQIDASSLATGRYQYTMTVTSYYGSATSTHVHTGYQNIVNLQGSEFGKGWTLAEKDGLAVQSGGVLWYSGTGNAAWFASNGSGGFLSPAGPLNMSTLTLTGGVYTLTDKFGNAENFSSAGLLTSKVDNNGNTSSYSYSSGKLATITDPFGRTTSFNYTSSLVSSIVDMAGQTTTLAHTGTNLTSITAPVPATGVAAPVTSYAYTGNLLTTISDPISRAAVLTYSYGDRLSQVTYPDSATNGFTPAEMVGLVNTSSGTGTSSSSPATPCILT